MTQRDPAPSAAQPRHLAPDWQVWAALLAVYLIWGSTYLAIRITVESIPPFLAAGVRFVVAGAALSLVLAARGGLGRLRVTRWQVAGAALIGVALLVTGNGFVMVAEQQVPSGLAALVIAAVPLWVVVLRAVTGERVARLTMAGVACGFAGVGLLVLRDGLGGHGTSLLGMLILLVASMSWATGSFISRRVSLPHDPLVSTAVQMLVAGLVLLVAAVGMGEASGLNPARVSAGSVIALVYLVIFGSLVGFSAYTWLLQNAPISKVATYAYVNPVIALALGWLLLAEPISPTILAGAGLVIVSVAAIVTRESRPSSRAVVAPEPVGTAEPVIAGEPIDAASPVDTTDPATERGGTVRGRDGGDRVAEAIEVNVGMGD